MAKSHLVIKTHANIVVKDGDDLRLVEGNHVRFCPFIFFRAAGKDDRSKAFGAIERHFRDYDDLALFGEPSFFASLLEAVPQLSSRVSAFVIDKHNRELWETESGRSLLPNVPRLDVSQLDAKAPIFLGDLEAFQNMRRRQGLRDSQHVLIGFDEIVDANPHEFPASGWFQTERHIYPIDLPEIEFREGLDLLLLDCPARNLALMPNGLGYVHNALKRTSLNFQTFDVDVVTYHAYHIRRIFDLGGKVFLKNGVELPLDPWQAHNYDLWSEPEVIDHFASTIDHVAAAIIAANPKILAFSIHGCNEAFTRRVINIVRAALPDVQVVVGGYSCYNPDIGRRGFPECDYMFMGEADLSLGPVVEALAKGERPKNVPGAISRYDDPSVDFIPAPMAHDLDWLDFPKYEWLPLSTYRLYSGYQLVPVVASRGCRWSRCSFCAERFYWRIRTAVNFVDEIQWFVEQGCYLFMFNESDLNGMPERLVEICEEIVHRNLHTGFIGQLRIHKKNDASFFKALKSAGFRQLRYGVDAFSEKALRLQQKGYTKEMVTQTLRECVLSGITTEINWVIGVPGETEEDLDEAIEFLIENAPYIGRVANIHPLMLANGSVYWLDPELHKIKFRAPVEKLYEQFPKFIPGEYWYSTEPYIDFNVRQRYFEKSVIGLSQAGVKLGPWAQRIVDDVQNRTGFNKVLDVDSGDTPSELALPEKRSVLVGQHRGYNLFQLDRLFYAVPENLGEIPLIAADRLPPEVLVENSQTVLTNHIDNTLAWANSRGGGLNDSGIRRARSSMPEAVDFEGLALASRDWLLPPEDRIISLKNGWYAVPKQTIGDAIPIFACSKMAETETRGLVGHYTVLEHDLVFYAIPDFDGEVDLKKLARPDDHGILRADTMLVLDRLLEDTIGFSRNDASRSGTAREMSSGYGAAGEILNIPREIKRFDGYRLLSFEGWVYGIPMALGEPDLRNIDVMELDGVIRDVSADVVENQIVEQVHLTRSLAISIQD